ncbi:MAG: hypothetical protein RL497_56 [Pseudomonadota bacterium]
MLGFASLDGLASVSNKTIYSNIIENNDNLTMGNIFHELLHINEAVALYGANATDKQYQQGKSGGI